MAPSTLLRLSALAALTSVASAASGDVNTAVTVRPLLSSHRQRNRTTADSSRGYQADGERIIAGYVPSIALAVVGIVLYGASTLALWVQWFRTGRKLYMLTLNISMACASPVCLAAGTSRLTCCARPIRRLHPGPRPPNRLPRQLGVTRLLHCDVHVCALVGESAPVLRLHGLRHAQRCATSRSARSRAPG